MTSLSGLSSADAGVMRQPAPHAATLFYRWHLAMPLIVATVLLIWLERYTGNRLIADHLYAWEGGHWLLREHVVTSQWIHPGGRYLSVAMWCATFALWWQSRHNVAWQRVRAPLACLLLSTFAAALLVTLMKSFTAMDCPWDMNIYGGLRPYLGLFDARPLGLHSSGCFPAGHASSGYAWVALYFFLGDVAPRWRFRGLALGLAMGGVFGISQQLRGAHFASHDLVSALVCWLAALAVHRAMRPAQGRRQ